MRPWPDADYPFMPHITLGRFPREVIPDVNDVLRIAQDVDPAPVGFEIGCIELMESIRGENGVEYGQAAPPFTLGGLSGARN